MYLETSEQLDVLHSMQEVLWQLQRDEKNRTNLKWATIALCSALNSMLVCNLSGSMQIGALRQNDAVTEIQRLNNREPIAPQKLKLAGPHDLLERVRGLSSRMESAGPNIQIPESEVLSFRELFSVRNQFMHFEPQSWFIQVGWLLTHISTGSRLAERIATDDYSLRHLSQQQQIEVRNICPKVKARCSELQVKPI
ncbi:hypothetical protein [Thalassobacter stenotrophicus]|uniref:Uncharacterized protein n=2 Tax=Thalassobacter stenotrophicus TaxID=266809 RepID=A0A0P1EXV7_9RHOB|nr:hypothetical protein [Thalassobacter stenotrophicus]PVZ49759.1 hypothetical protein DD557_14090 [Thalassobacter stenotrophicus]CUH59795.1 hypothetical protein THS5294_01083 [Thalassobacter stenotrophicus]SHI89047.1 hypothetical protein SAMN02744035_01914 [Thalassobacter stenotrophicus DSM 16310]